MVNKIYSTGDTHGCAGILRRFSNKNFTADEQTMVFIAGDFGGVWDFDSRFMPYQCYLKKINGKFGESNEEKYTLDWLAKKPYSICFCPGNHENYDRLYRAYPQVNYYGGKAREIRKNVHMLENGELFDFDGYRVLSLGGARSHDIKDGIVDPTDFESKDKLKCNIRYRRMLCQLFRINHVNWWKEEIPDNEMLEKFKQNAFTPVNLLLTHDAPTFMYGYAGNDLVKRTLNEVAAYADYRKWIAGHHHIHKFMGREILLYNEIVRLA
jgi:hypothetical protein